MNETECARMGSILYCKLLVNFVPVILLAIEAEG